MGVDSIVAAIFASTDHTTNILKEYERQGLLHLIGGIEGESHDELLYRLCRLAYEQYGAEILFQCDADEFWLPRSGNLKNEITLRSEDILAVDVVNVLLRDRNGKERFPEDARYAVVEPIIEDFPGRIPSYDNPYLYERSSKMISKSIKKFKEASRAQHTVNGEDTVKLNKSQDITIYRYPVRSRDHFYSKAIRKGKGGIGDENEFASNNQSRKLVPNESDKKGLLNEEYNRVVLPRHSINGLLHEGTIEEHDFNLTILGIERGTSQWSFFNRKFEYEAMMDPLATAWYGHIFFAYDLVRNVRPAKIVELGTHNGHSFFSFCQAVKDGYLNTELYAIDTWKGDEQAGFYDQSVWLNVNRIKDTFYSSIRINLVRKSFDEAVDDFRDKSIDILHIDGCHTYEAVKNDFERWVGKVKDNGIVLFHDTKEIHDDYGVFRLWDELGKQYKTIDFYHSHGLGILFKSDEGFPEIFEFDRAWQNYYSVKMDKGFLAIIASRLTDLMKLKDGEISRLRDLIRLEDGEISRVIDLINLKDREIDTIKSSKFWKLRTFCAKLKKNCLLKIEF
jgi:hypothetical protein